jgi:signal transduction histidine kinase
MKRFSLNRQLIIAVVASQVLLAAGLVLVGTSLSRHYIRSAFDVYIQGRAQSIAALVYFRDDGVPGLLFNDAKVPPSPHHIHKDIFLVKSDHGDFAQHSPGTDPRFFDQVPATKRFWDFEIEGEPYRAIILRDVAVLDTEVGEPLPLPRLTVFYAAPTMDIEQQMRNLAIAIGVLGLLVLVPTLILALWSMRRALAPLKDLATAASAISVDRWKFEPSDAAKSTEELVPLIGAVQTVLEGLEAAFTRQRQFLGDAAHELKTSLAILKSSLQAMLNKPRQREEYEHGLAVMSGDCDRLERLLNRMLQTARAEQRIAKGQDYVPDPVDVVASCEQAIARLAQFAAAREVVMEFTASSEAIVLAEAADLELIWLNLLENAIQYSPRGASIAMNLVADGRSVAVSVADHGCGIDAAHLPHIFKRFYRVDSSRARSTGGFGLGLAVAKSLVDFYQGRIRAASEPGSGTRITVELPLHSGSAGNDHDNGEAIKTRVCSAG